MRGVIEIATERIVILASPEIVAQLQADWSEPVQWKIHGDRQPDGTYDVTLRTHTCGEWASDVANP